MIKIRLDAYLNGVIPGESAPFQEKQRRVLGLYDDKNIDYGFASNPIQLHAALPLNHLGYAVEPLNLRIDPLPDDKTMENYNVIVTWFKKPSIPNAMSYLIWIEKQMAKGKKLIVLEYTGLEQDDTTGESYPNDLKARLLRLIGLEYRGFARQAGKKVAVDWKDAGMIGFERHLARYPGEYAWIVPQAKNKVQTWLVITHADFPKGASSIVTTSAKGGYAMHGYVTWEEPNTADPRYQWYINPFLFFGQILEGKTVPLPDPTTVNGKRVFFSHVDGDSFHSFSQVQPGSYSSEVLLDFFTNVIPDIPIGISFIAAEIDSQGGESVGTYQPNLTGVKSSDGSPLNIRGQRGNKRLLETAKKIAALPNVELASHTYHHPYVWQGAAKPSAYKQTPFDVDFEIRSSIDYINRFIAPHGKQVKILFWTGNTTPGLDAFAILEELGVDNLNGGDSVYDSHFASVSNVAPYARKNGKYWQFFTCQSNENLYTDLWRNDFNGLENVIETMKRTESPRRLQCANLYYHFYSGDKIASINALKKVYQWVKQEGYEAVYPSRYLAMVKGFLSTRIFILEPNRYVIANRGELNTFRLDSGEVDIKRSFGIRAVDIVNGSRYISLDPSVEYPILQID